MQETGVLHDHLVGLGHVQEGGDQLVVVDGDDVVQVFLDVGEHLVAGSFDGHAVGDGVHGGQGDHVPRLQAGLHAGRAGGFHADDLHVGVEELCQGGHAACQAAAADGDEDDVHVREVAEDLIGDGALTGGHRAGR